MMANVLGEHPQRVALAVLREEQAKRRHLVVALSGAHAYGFPSPDSDHDLKAIHIAPTATLLGLAEVPTASERAEVIEGVEGQDAHREEAPVRASHDSHRHALAEDRGAARRLER
jgi:hypothetical protein